MRLPTRTGSHPRNSPATHVATAALLLFSLALPITDAAPTPGTGFVASLDVGYPADPTGAVSSTRVVTFVNGGFRIHDRAGTQLDSRSLHDFWDVTGGSFDPRAVYDPYGNRFIVTTLIGADKDTREFAVAASTSSSPNSDADWHKYRIRFDSTGACTPDFSTIGFNKDWIVISYHHETNRPSCAWQGGTSIITFQKAQVYSGQQTVTYVKWDVAPSALCGGSCDKAVMPATTFSNTLDRVYLLNEYNRDNAGGGQLQLRTISGPAAAPVLSNAAIITAPNSATWHNAPDAPQLGTTDVLDTGGTKIDSLVYRNGDLWAAQTVGLPSTGATRASVQWWQIDPAGPVKQFGRIDDASGKYRYFGSLSVNSNNDVLVGYTLSSSTMYANAAYAWRQGNTAKNTMGGIDIISQAGESSYSGDTRSPDGTWARWGDYSTTSVDPVNDRYMWTLQQSTTNNDLWRASWKQAQFSTAAFDATFTGVRGNEWWVQAQVGTNSAALRGVDVRINGGAWQPLTDQGWGWAASYHVIQGSVVQLRATAADGSTDFSSCYQWIPPANTDATIVSCAIAFDATFTTSGGNDWWVEATVTGNKPISAVHAQVNCGATWTALNPTAWGTWAKSFNVPSGSKVVFRATANTGETDLSGGYTWPSGTPTSGC